MTFKETIMRFHDSLSLSVTIQIIPSRITEVLGNITDKWKTLGWLSGESYSNINFYCTVMLCLKKNSACTTAVYTTMLCWAEHLAAMRNKLWTIYVQLFKNTTVPRCLLPCSLKSGTNLCSVPWWLAHKVIISRVKNKEWKWYLNTMAYLAEPSQVIFYCQAVIGISLSAICVNITQVTVQEVTCWQIKS